jgi:hypothetical protein
LTVIASPPRRKDRVTVLPRRESGPTSL